MLNRYSAIKNASRSLQKAMSAAAQGMPNIQREAAFAMSKRASMPMQRISMFHSNTSRSNQLDPKPNADFRSDFQQKQQQQQPYQDIYYPPEEPPRIRSTRQKLLDLGLVFEGLSMVLRDASKHVHLSSALVHRGRTQMTPPEQLHQRQMQAFDTFFGAPSQEQQQQSQQGSLQEQLKHVLRRDSEAILEITAPPTSKPTIVTPNLEEALELAGTIPTADVKVETTTGAAHVSEVVTPVAIAGMSPLTHLGEVKHEGIADTTEAALPELPREVANETTKASVATTTTITRTTPIEPEATMATETTTTTTTTATATKLPVEQEEQQQQQQQPIVEIVTATTAPPKPDEVDPVVEVATPPQSQADIAMDSQKLQKSQFKPRERSVPSSSISRMMHFGGLGVRIALGSAGESIKRTFVGSGNEVGKQATSVILTEANVERLVQTLCRMRGAALKLGQMISIQDESLVPPQVQKIMERVRQHADIMPQRQLEKVLAHNFGGKDWKERLGIVEFDVQPIAAASIGQVHRAVLKDGREVAMKVQYPGVANSIDSDLNNLKRLISTMSILPKSMFLDTSITEIGRELRLECDYINEARNHKRFKELVADDPNFYVPEVIDHLSTASILTTEMVHGLSIDELVNTADQETRNKVSRRLLKLCLRELFEFRFMQTDPNWANFFYKTETDKLSLIDFGACRSFPKKFVDEYIRVVYGAAQRDKQMVLDASVKMGFLTGEETDIMNNAHAEAALIVGEPFAKDEPYDFRAQNMTKKIHKYIPVMLKHRLTPPPPESYSLHRKLSGAFLLCFKLGAVINCRDLLLEVWDNYKFGPVESTPNLAHTLKV